MQMRKLNYAIFATIFALTLSSAALSESESAIDTALLSSIAQLQKGWAEVNYQSQGDPQLEEFAVLLERATALVDANPQAAPAYIWRGIIESTYAGAKGGLGALKFAKAAKADLEKALELEPEAMSGSAYTSLGTLYFNVPGWPIAFGSDKKAQALLTKALTLNPDGIDSNYFYASFMRSQGRDEEARNFFLKAQRAAPRADRPLADAGRQKEISEALAALDAK